MSGEVKQAWSLECCWGCHLALLVPLHRISMRQLGMPKAHLKCFHPNLYERSQNHHLVLVDHNQVSERYCPKYFVQRHQPADDPAAPAQEQRPAAPPDEK